MDHERLDTDQSRLSRNLEQFIAVWDFEPSKKDEIALSKGDIVFVVKKYKDGWYRGIRYRGYQAGCFPGNFVEKDSSEIGNLEWQDLPSPTSEGNSKVLEDLQNDRTKLTSEANGTDDQCEDMEGRQPDANHNNELNRSDSHNSDNLSPGPLTSFHGLNIIAEQMGQEGEESEERKRTRAAMELLTSEVSYFNGLNLLSGHYIRPLRKLRIISNEDVKKIFANAESLESISKELVAKLQTRLAHWDVNTTLIGDVLVEMFSYLMMFEPYFKSRKRGNEVKMKLEKNNEKFRNFLAKVSCNHTLDSLLLMPIQRVPRYELILKELVKRTHEDHPDYENLKEAQSKAQKTAEALNEHIRQIENETKVVEVMKSFPNDELNLIRPAATQYSTGKLYGSVRLRKHERDQMTSISKTLKRISLPLMDSIETQTSPKLSQAQTAMRSQNTLLGSHNGDSSDSDSETDSASLGETFITSAYIYEGEVERVTKKATGSNDGGMVHETVERYLFLFNNVLLVSMASENRITGKKTYKLKDCISLVQAWVTSPSTYYTNPPDKMFILGTPTQIYKFLAPSERQKEKWENKLKTHIEKEKQAFVESFQGLPVPDEEFLAVSFDAKIDYHQTVDFELNLRQSEEVLVIGVKAGNLWLPGFFSSNVCELDLVWWPGLYKGKFGWFPAQCVTGPDMTTYNATNEFHPIPVATALNEIKQKMMDWTGSFPKKPITEDMTMLKVFKPDKTFKTCKVETGFLISDVMQQYTRHRSFVGGQIDASVLEMWEESIDGSVHRHLDPGEKLSNIFAMWGKYQGKMKLVVHNKDERHSKDERQGPALHENQGDKPEPPTGVLIYFD